MVILIPTSATTRPHPPHISTTLPLPQPHRSINSRCLHTALEPTWPPTTHTQVRESLLRIWNGADTIAGQLTFKDSPFYQIKRSLTSVVECKGDTCSSSVLGECANWFIARENTRDTARANIDLPAEVVDLLNIDANYRVMVFCSADVSALTPTEISFPHQVELKCNGNEVKANLRGLKGKPGSTRPADITSFIKKKIPGYQNVLEMVYALTNKVCAPFLRQHLSLFGLRSISKH